MKLIRSRHVSAQDGFMLKVALTAKKSFGTMNYAEVQG